MGLLKKLNNCFKVPDKQINPIKIRPETYYCTVNLVFVLILNN